MVARRRRDRLSAADRAVGLQVEIVHQCDRPATLIPHGEQREPSRSLHGRPVIAFLADKMVHSHCGIFHLRCLKLALAGGLRNSQRVYKELRN